MPKRPAKKRPSLPDRGLSSYTLILPSAEWHAVKALAALRGTTIRDLVRELILGEIEEARRRGEIPR